MASAWRPARAPIEVAPDDADPLPAPTDDDGPAWHALDAEEVRRRLRVGRDGLHAAEAASRLAHHGPNALEDERPPSALVVLARQSANPFIYILIGAAVVTVLLQEYLDAAVVAFVVVLNAVIGFVQERKAESAVRALMQLVVPHARAVRGGQEWEVDSRDLVPGDVVLLEPGSRVPADLRLEVANGLQVDESLLTGESVPVTKHTRAVPEGASLADRSDLAHTGSIVTSGRGRGIVVATGTRTELGQIAGLIRTEVAERSPLQRRMDHFATVIGLVVGASVALVFVSGLVVGESAGDIFLTAVALAVAAIPEGLPVAFTVTLALGVHRMARRRAIIRRLPAVETLGSTTVIGSDKTGTLTQNRMTVQAVWTGGRRFERTGEGAGVRFVPADGGAAHDGPADGGGSLERTLLAGVLTNEAEAYLTEHGLEVVGDPTEAALLVAAWAVGLEPEETREAHPMVAEVPFEPERRYSAAVCADGDHHEVFVKGAPETVLGLCRSQRTAQGDVPLDPAAVRAAAADLAARGLRVLAMAERRLPHRLGPAPDLDDLDDLDGLDDGDGMVLLGLQGMLDPPRDGVAEAIATCREAGIRVVMITGDHADTARAIAEDLGLADAPAAVLTGEELAGLTDEELSAEVGRVDVYARAAPEDKLRIVRALQAGGEVVAVTGDGVNDAPALKAAAIGVAMGDSGTDVAREASDMVLADDDFVSIASAVEEGRVTFDNVRKVTFFLVSTGAATILAILASVWLRWPLLLLPAQLLWLNLVTNGLQDKALAFEPGERGVLRRRPRDPREGLLTRRLWERVLLVGIVMAAATMALFHWELETTGSLTRARTVALTTMVVAMAFHVGSARSERDSVLRLSPTSNPFLALATVAALGIHVAALHLPPTQYVLRVEPIEAAAWLRIVVVASSVLVAVELDKAIRRRLRRRSRSAGGSDERGQGP